MNKFVKRIKTDIEFSMHDVFIDMLKEDCCLETLCSNENGKLYVYCLVEDFEEVKESIDFVLEEIREEFNENETE